MYPRSWVSHNPNNPSRAGVESKMLLSNRDRQGIDASVVEGSPLNALNVPNPTAAVA